MAFEGLSSRLQDITRRIKGEARITESNMKDMLREVKLALLEADVNYKIVKEFIASVQEKALGQDVMKSLKPGEQVVKIVRDELTELLGGTDSKINISPNPPTVIMLVGLQGAGKTTMAGKLANYLRKQGKKPLMVACDVYRPAAVKQLQVVGAQLNIPVYAEEGSKNVIGISKRAMNTAMSKLNDVVIIDTAGRLQIDEALMQELQDVKKAVRPHEILLVVDSMTGQEAVNVAESFNEKVGIDGVVLTKLDGDTRGGAALSIREITGKPIKFTGTGEKITDIETFHPDRMSSRILGMGDLLTLIEKASQEYDEKKSLELAEKMRENTFDFNDFIDQLDQVQNMGPMEDLLKMLPGMANNPALANVKVDEKQIARKRAIVSSMTPEERENPDLLTPSRRRRIANGSGNTFIEVNKFIKDFNQAKQMMQGVMSGDMEQMMRQMGLNPNNLPKNMPNMPDMGNMDMSALEGMMGGAGMPDLGNMDLSQMLGGGLKGKVGSFAMKHAMKRQANKMKKAKKKRK